MQMKQPGGSDALAQEIFAMSDLANASAARFLAVDAAAGLLVDAADGKPGQTLAEQVMRAATRLEDGQPAAKVPKPRRRQSREAGAAQWLTGDNLYL